MKKFAQRFTAVLLAAVMTVSALGISVSAKTENNSAETSAADAQTETPKYTGWEPCETGWLYLKDGVPYVSKYYKDSLRIDGIHYHFSMYGVCIGKYTGWSESGKRYYKDGLLYTGWLNKNDGTKQYYCLDGYPVTGDFQIGDTVYSFDKNGIYKGKSSPALLTASCAEKVSADAEKILIKVTHNGGSSNEYLVGNPEKMERWENGKWKRCGKSAQYAVDDIGMIIDGTDDCSPNSAAVAFYPNRYMGGDMPTGYYRIAVTYGENGNYSKTKKDVYAIFEAVPAVEVKPSREVFLTNGRNDTTVSIIATSNSKKESLKPEALAGSLKLEIMKKTDSGWEPYEDNGYSAGYTDSENKLEIAAEFSAEAGYYKAMINLGGNDYSVPFRVISIEPIPWLDEYSLKSDDIAVSFTLYNRYEDTVKIGTDLINLVKKENGQWTDMQDRAARFGCIEIEPAYTALEAEHKTALTFNLSDLYDTSKLAAGDYAVWIDGAGYAEFRLTDKEPKSGEFPFAGIKAADVKEIQLIMHECGGDHEIKVSFKKGEYFDRTLNHLRQLKFEKSYEKYSNDKAGFGGFDVVVRLNDGKKKTLSYCDSDAVIYNGRKVYKCNWQVYYALNDFLIEASGIDKKYYGYR